MLKCPDGSQWSAGWTHYGAAVSFVRENCGDPINRDIVARRIGIHPKYLGRLFAKHAGERFTDFLTRVRLKRALALLEERRLNVAEVAHACGFSNPHHFIRSFKKAYSVTPGRYRLSTGATEGDTAALGNGLAEPCASLFRRATSSA